MPYNTKDILRDLSSVPIPQVWDEVGDQYRPAPGDPVNGMDVDVTRLPPLPAGINNIGDVDIASIGATADPHAVSAWSVAGAAQDNLPASATRAAEVGKSHYITGVSAAFSAAVAGKLLEIKDGATVIYRTYVHNARDLTFPKPLQGTAGNAVSAELAASGTAGQFGVVSLAGYTI
jgi:hypothetical protein